MTKSFRLAIVLVLMSAVAGAADETAETLFVRRIAPLLQTKCLACHGADEKKLEGNLDLRDLKAALKGGDSG